MPEPLARLKYTKIVFKGWVLIYKAALVHSSIVVGLTLIFAGPVVVVGCLAYPYLHSHYVHPLGRLARQVEIGQSCDLVANRFAKYTQSSATSPEAQHADHILTFDLNFTKEISPSRGLSIHDLSAFDDLQLLVRCSSSNQVAEVLFSGD
jgi:hypothetical protein